VSEREILLTSFLIPLLLELFEFFAVRKEDAVLFPPKIGWRLFYFLLGAFFFYWTIGYVSSIHLQGDKVSLWPVLITFAAWLTRPKTLAASTSGLASYGLFGLRRSFLPWIRVASITSHWKHDGAEDKWGLLEGKPSVTVASADAKGMTFSYMHGGLGRFIDELRKHIPASAFAAGLYDWHP